ncbi:hypothetical protein Athai_61100 [Actinocatenispora thailandica]|uniref:Uncharacterized protein n=1 Tax=Actinocatenispora thailandica TaxID=227318 RepID=A0A7R7DVH2_9ACTN|nr:hypothetical protein [Actinocatenispora thailandica]BCJ38607.1 hypothetical protein Athai_61100 [Actinocatenispora thailandica]
MNRAVAVTGDDRQVPPAPVADASWQPMNQHLNGPGYLVMLQPEHRATGTNDALYWCGHARWDCFVNALSYRDPHTGAVSPAEVAVYPTVPDALHAWRHFVADRRARRLAPPAGCVEITELGAVEDPTARPSRPARSPRSKQALPAKDASASGPIASEALFASEVQFSRRLAAAEITETIHRMLRQLGRRGCTERVAQEFGDHPELAVQRMRDVNAAIARCTPSDPTPPPVVACGDSTTPRRVPTRLDTQAF